MSKIPNSKYFTSYNVQLLPNQVNGHSNSGLAACQYTNKLY